MCMRLRVASRGAAVTMAPGSHYESLCHTRIGPEAARALRGLHGRQPFHCQGAPAC